MKKTIQQSTRILSDRRRSFLKFSALVVGALGVPTIARAAALVCTEKSSDKKFLNLYNVHTARRIKGSIGLMASSILTP